ncbi:MAG: flagellar hook-basal body protein [Solirubrobacteraceae bacterium]|nr:flagellar hook-basal body protein [Solirubrobacteraceae bacterium]
MLQGLYSAAAGMSAQQTRMDAVSHDLANTSTPGYKQERVAFRDLLYVRDGVEGVRAGSGSAAATIGRGTSQGALQATGRSLDVAITGAGYLQVTRPDGSSALTRAGVLQVDASGRLVTPSGDRLDGVGPLPAGTDVDKLGIGDDGTVRTADGTEVGRLRLVNVTAPDLMRPVGDNLFAPTAESGAPTVTGNARLVQGHLEASAVNVADAMTDLIESQRAFAMASRAVQTQDQMLEIANGVKR